MHAENKSKEETKLKIIFKLLNQNESKRYKVLKSYEIKHSYALCGRKMKS